MKRYKEVSSAFVVRKNKSDGFVEVVGMDDCDFEHYNQFIEQLKSKEFIPLRMSISLILHIILKCHVNNDYVLSHMETLQGDINPTDMQNMLIYHGVEKTANMVYEDYTDIVNIVMKKRNHNDKLCKFTLFSNGIIHISDLFVREVQKDIMAYIYQHERRKFLCVKKKRHQQKNHYL